LKAVFNATDRVDKYYVFDIGGNKYRIIASIHFNTQRLYIREVCTHKEYDSWKP
jgi:mRNA interferase HigB